MDAAANREIDGYIEALYDDHDEVRTAMEALARERAFPIVGPQVGRLLGQLARTVGARRVFEMGSGFGYSALFLARAVGEGGSVHCTELDAANVALAEDFLARAGVSGRVAWHREEGRACLRRLGGTWDLVFSDIDKDAYPDTVDLAWAHLRTGGLFVTDNVLWHGRVLPGRGDGSEETRGVEAFTQSLLDHPGFYTTLLPVRDGVAVSLKL